jgi:pentapeptide MXKDX repeat protein
VKSIPRLLAIAGFAGALLTGTAFAQSASGGAMSSSDHMTGGTMSAMKKEHKSSGTMLSHGSAGEHMKASHMKSGHMKAKRHGKKMSHHMTSGTMSSDH